MNLEDAKLKAAEKAIEEGYDQFIFLNKKKKYDFKRLTKVKNARPSKVVCYVRLFYKEHQLIPRVVEVM